MKRITPMITDEQHEWLLKYKEETRESIEQSTRKALDLFIKKKNREAKR